MKANNKEKIKNIKNISLAEFLTLKGYKKVFEKNAKYFNDKEWTRFTTCYNKKMT